MRRLSLIAVACALTACLGTPYSRPDVAVPAQFRFAMAETTGAADTQWWLGFGDPELDALVAEALANNEDLRIAAARVDEFHGAKVTTRAPLFPGVGYTASSGQERPSAQVVGRWQRRRGQLERRGPDGRLGNRRLGPGAQPHGSRERRLDRLRGGSSRDRARAGRRGCRGLPDPAVARRPAQDFREHAREPSTGARRVREASQGRRDFRG